MSLPTPDPAALLYELEQRARDQAQPSGPKVWGPQIEQHTFWPVYGLARFWEPAAPGAPEVDYPQHLADVLAGLHAPGRTFRSFVAGTPEGVALYYGLELEPGAAADPLPALLRGVFPGIELGAPVQHIARPLDRRGLFNAAGMMTGIPTLKLNPDPQRGRGVALQIERLLRGLAGATWGYLVVAAAVPGPATRGLARRVQEQIGAVSPLVKQQVSTQSAHKEQVGAGVGTVSTSAESMDSTAQRCLELLQRNAQRMDEAQASGLWQTTVYCFGSDAATRDRAAALLRAIFAGAESLPEPVRTFARMTDNSLPDRDAEFATLLTGREAAALCQLPREEFPGYALRDFARFDSDLPRPRPQDGVALGRVLDGGSPSGHEYTLERRDLTKHGLIAGVTGSGKTTTVFSLLDQVYDGGKGVPFLVIEPAKAEYRGLMQAAGRFPGLRVFTLGDERHAPFRLNPFAFAIGDAQHRIHVQTHIDHLKAVFNAAFVLYAPMPYVLESCLHEVYTDKGWDLATSTNNRLPLPQHGQEALWPVFPTLTDLYRKVDEVVDRLGYEARIEMDVKAGLKARIGSLRLGGKGFMLDTQRSFPMRDLLAHPTVLEMAPVGNEDEKAFLLGLLLTALYEHHIVQAQMGAQTGAGLAHLTVLEEAHRLLKNVSTQQDTESANTRGQAVETFTNMLSEIRSYGEGVIIAEQIPTKLAPDAIKNTNLKVVHRLLAGDDRAVLAATMNMDEAQSRFLTTLRAGQAAVFAEGADHPYLVAMEDFKARLAGRVADADVRAAMAAVCAGPVYDPVPDFGAHFPAALVQALAQQGIGLPAVRNRAVQVLEHPDFGGSFDRYVLAIVEQPQQGVRGFAWLRRLARQLWVDEAALRPVLLYAVLAAVEDHAMRRGQQYRWAYHRVGNAYAPLRRALAQVARDFPYAAPDAQVPALLDQLWAAVEADLRAFQAAYAKLTEAHAPYAGCSVCATRCRYRFEAAHAAARPDLREEFEHVFAATGAAAPQALWPRLAEHCRAGAFQVVGLAKTDVPPDAVLCYALHAAREQRLSAATESTMLAALKKLVKP